MYIQPLVAKGKFYPEDKDKLELMLSSFFSKIKDLPTVNQIQGIVVPHAGYVYSGKTAAYAYKTLYQFLETTTASKINYIILAPNHTGLGKANAISNNAVWQLPFGEVNICSEIVQSFLKTSRYLQEDIVAFANEHAVEVQLPFIQYIHMLLEKNSKKIEYNIVPIILGTTDPRVIEEISEKIKSASASLPKDHLLIVVASSDMSHYVSQDEAENKDKLLINSFLKGDWKNLKKVVEENHISACGYIPICCLLASCDRKPMSLFYTTSADVTNDKSNVVGYFAGAIC
ncbi:MAG: AmmeMemoRadiSam system protein B [Candidatus Huberarchaeum crystalense]|uniref:MEMO1 family protein CO072_00520 n=1 Tax=Huberarchaeum crystalense TaxID=2014257 RepID=A0A2G9LIU9_HUBC1|nr:AmmeMemoRadiSam system protein B [archaeon]OIP20302.1 MAG: AmmeMemoRadiSam system protein B [archaeon CG2_30_31_98]PIN66451.1 MAG: AmmeMemoRadiSam system protein B [Candidatus Huberarchaeum crystalense]NCS98161.1 AmmeMemoRadiSam system protein B [archaeon]PIV13721.1 MAG: AmmeMemoRadiSam system protein B [Candidatus Huberarchaeum crystalense]